ncbi:LacI family DNA-binding transcriptional regulator [Jidongwangia harbinensis]|uniref:LacI family DNA-binding transcriptional regulator n=1 Tax=Jidongwangia harbinensis TaxID=2878561 RepID=UPI001CDA0106|nr:LacI family DNA-binding transcriptional regulator [Jidongwangia harbinensis]MCA2216183.1 LacI family transcriptional regulator [Jidongwangia harbinensis]
MSDIARRAGVSRIAVSYAINNRPGVSDHLRSRILGIASEMGYRANGAALAMHGAAAGAVGLVMLRSSAAVTVEVFHRHLIAGIQTELSARGFGLALQFVADLDEEVAVHRRWSAERRVDGVLIVNPSLDDPRMAAVEELNLPAVVVGGAPGTQGVWSDGAAAVTEVADHLIAQGHRRIARVSGPANLRHTAVRDAALRRAPAEVTIVRGDYTGASGARLTRELLDRVHPPTAIVYDNDVMAVAGLGAARERGYDVPGRLSIVAGDDSPLCQLVAPALTAVRRDIPALGMQAARLLFDVIGGVAPGSVQAETGRLVVRRSSGPPSTGGG